MSVSKEDDSPDIYQKDEEYRTQKESGLWAEPMRARGKLKDE